MIKSASKIVPDGTPTSSYCNNNPHHLEYVYVVIPGEKNNKNKELVDGPIYKIGKTNRLNFDRVKEYGNGANLLIQIKCINSTECERAILHDLRNNIHITKHDRGNEYFETSRDDIIIDTVIYHARRSIGCIADPEYLFLLNINAVVMTSRNSGYVKISDKWEKIIDIHKYLTTKFNQSSSSVRRRGLDINGLLDGQITNVKVIKGVPHIDSQEVQEGVYVHRSRSYILRCFGCK
jgi:hypothetical protein